MYMVSKEKDLQKTVRMYFRSRQNLSSFYTEDVFVKKVMDDATISTKQKIADEAQRGITFSDEDIWDILKNKVEEYQILNDPTQFNQNGKLS